MYYSQLWTKTNELLRHLMSFATERPSEQERLVWMSCREVHPQSVTAPWSQLRISKGHLTHTLVKQICDEDWQAQPKLREI